MLSAFVIFGIGGQTNATATCTQSSQAKWINTAIAKQTSKFTATFEATPSRSDMNGVIGFSLNAASGYTSLTASVRFSAAGKIDVWNGGTYASARWEPYSPGKTYRIRMVISPTTKTYNVYATPPGGSEVVLATNYAFRSEASGASALNNWGIFADIGSESVCNMAITNSAESSVSWTPSSVGFGDVNLGSSKTLPVTIQSTGLLELIISNVSLSGSGFSATGLPMGLILLPGKTATLDVKFAPWASGSITGSAVITTNSLISPTIKVQLSGTGVAPLSHSTTLSWIASTSSVVGYNVYRAMASGGPYAKLNSSSVLPLKYTDTTVIAGQNYFYFVTALNASGEESAHSNEVTVTIP